MKIFIMAELHRQSERDRQKKWVAANPEKVRAKQARYNLTEKAKLRLVKYQKSDKGKARSERFRKTEKYAVMRARNRPKYKEKEKAYLYAWRKSERGKQLTRSSTKAWRDANREKMRAYARERVKRFWATPRGKLIILARNRIRHVFRSMGTRMPASASKMIGCDWDTLKVHIESQFAEGMTWENYGQWHCDHKDPIASFDLTDPEQVSRCFSWRNLQPLWAVDNLSKGAKLVYVKNNSNSSVTCPQNFSEKN